jgi:hypothetical protein
MWSFLGAILALYVANAWSRSQGGPAIGGDILFDPRPIIASFYAILFSGPVTAIVCGIGILYARRSGKVGWSERMPLSWMPESEVGEINRTDWATKFYLLFTLLIFVGLPSAGIWHFSKKVLFEGVIYNRNLATIEHVRPYDILPLLGDRQTSPVMTTRNADDGSLTLRLASNIHEAKRARDRDYNPPTPGDISKECRENTKLCRGVDWYPLATPLALLVSVFLCWGMAISFVIQLMRRAPGAKASNGS